MLDKTKEFKSISKFQNNGTKKKQHLTSYFSADPRKSITTREKKKPQLPRKEK